MPDDFTARFEQLAGQPIIPVRIDVQDYSCFKTLYSDMRVMIDDEKLLEYYISYRWLEFNPSDTYIDVAAQDCPFAFFIRDRFNCRVYRQDLYFLEKGIHGEDIGGDASKIPLPRNSVSKISLHNSLEHFEGDSDIQFIRKAQRLLRPGGKLLVVPLFIGDEYTIETDAGWVDEEGVKHLWCEGARFARIYDLPQFKYRILENSKQLKLQVYHLQNANEIDPKIYAEYFAIFEKLK